MSDRADTLTEPNQNILGEGRFPRFSKGLRGGRGALKWFRRWCATLLPSMV